jgi:parallel beta-helix repeat protein
VKRSTLIAMLIAIMICSLASVGNFHFGTVKGDTPVTGIISSDTTWTKANSPYNLTGPVGITAGVTLTIEAGVTVNFDEFYLVVNGTLDARGSSIDKIYFISDKTSLFWFNAKGIIVFLGMSKSWNEQDKTGSIIENAIISSTQQVPTVYIEDTSPKINNCTVSNAGNQRAIFVEGGASIISNNTITSSNEGISISSALFGESTAYVSNNTISNCKVGIEIYGGSPIIERNLIINNTGNKISGNGGIRIDYAYTGTRPLIRNNTITKNSVGFNLLDSPSPIITFNNIYDNNEYSIYLYSGSAADVNATYNWWGTNDTEAINQTIFDFKNDFNLGRVTFVPFLTEPNSATPVIPDTYSILIMPLLIIATLVGVLFHKKKHHIK